MNKYTTAFLLFGMILIFIPGAILFLVNQPKLGAVLMLIYVIPTGILALAMLVYLAIEFIQDWKNN